jgi:hypothetical protein
MCFCGQCHIEIRAGCDARFPISRFERQLAEDTDPFELLDACITLLASTEIWAGLGEHLSAIETKLCSPCNGRNQMQEFGLYPADASSSDKTSLRYNVSNFLNSATTRTFPLGSASP